MQGRMALELTKSLAPDLILLDVNLPDISGREALNESSSIPRPHRFRC